MSEEKKIKNLSAISINVQLKQFLLEVKIDFSKAESLKKGYGVPSGKNSVAKLKKAAARVLRESNYIKDDEAVLGF